MGETKNEQSSSQHSLISNILKKINGRNIYKTSINENKKKEMECTNLSYICVQSEG